MVMRIKFWVFILVLLSIPTLAAAADMGKKHSLIFSGGQSRAINGCESPWAKLGTPSSECAENSAIYRTAYNYRLTPTWGIEVSGGDLGRPRVKGTYQGGPSNWEMKIEGWTIAGIGIIPIGKSFSLFGKLGIVRSHFRESYGVTLNGLPFYGVSFNGVQTLVEGRNAPTYGAGFQIDFTKSFGLRLQYENFGQYDIYSAYGVSNPDKISISAVSAGLAFHF